MAADNILRLPGTSRPYRQFGRLPRLNPDAAIMRGCCFWLPATEGDAIARDVIGGQTGTLTGAETWGQASADGIVDPLGRADLVANLYNAARDNNGWLDFGTDSEDLGFQPCTIALWYRANQDRGANFLICKANGTNYDFGIYTASTKTRPYLYYGANLSVGSTSRLDDVLKDQKLHLIVIRIIGGKLCASVDDTFDIAQGSNISLSGTTAGRRLAVGGRWEGSAISSGFKWEGHGGDVRIWDRPLSNAEVLRMYDPATRWEHYWQPRPTVPIISAGPVSNEGAAMYHHLRNLGIYG